MRHIAIIGSGPAGYYTAEAALKAFGDKVRVDVFDTLPVPFGLIRTGVAPDHQSIKLVSRRYAKVALDERARFIGNVTVGRDATIEEMRTLYDAVILATGAPQDRSLGIPGCDLGNVFGSAAFVGWYNGHPLHSRLDPVLLGRTAVIVGMGNVALDVARILAKTQAELEASDIVAHAYRALAGSKIARICILGRRGPHAIAMTPKELGELGALERARPVVRQSDLPDVREDDALEPGRRKSVTLLRDFAAREGADESDGRLRIEFHFNVSPQAILGNDRIEAVQLARTRVMRGSVVPTGETFRLPADLLVSCIGYRTAPIAGVAFEEGAGRFANKDGRIAAADGDLGGLYCVGWARRGPTGTIGSNRPDGYALMTLVQADIANAQTGAGGKAGGAGFEALATERALDIVTFRDWLRIDQAEIAAARQGAPREKFVDHAAMLEARGAAVTTVPRDRDPQA